MDIIFILLVIFGPLLLPPIVETIFIRLHKNTFDPFIAALSVFLFWVPIFLSSANPSIFPGQEVQGIALVMGMGFSIFCSISYLVFSLTCHAIIRFLVKHFRFRNQSRYTYFCPWIALYLIAMLSFVLLILSWQTGFDGLFFVILVSLGLPILEFPNLFIFGGFGAFVVLLLITFGVIFTRKIRKVA